MFCFVNVPVIDRKYQQQLEAENKEQEKQRWVSGPLFWTVSEITLLDCWQVTLVRPKLMSFQVNRFIRIIAKTSENLEEDQESFKFQKTFFYKVFL